MSVTEDRRIALLEAANQHWGRDVAVTLMEMLPPSGWGDVATRQRVDALERDMDLRFQLVDEKFAAVDRRFDIVDERFAAVDRRFDIVDEKFAAVDRRFDIVDEKIDGVEARLRAEFRAGLAETQRTMIQWVVGTSIVTVSAAAGVASAIFAFAS